MDSDYQQQASVILQILQQCTKRLPDWQLPGLVLHFAILSPADVFSLPTTPLKYDQFLGLMSSLKRRIRSRCGGLVEIRLRGHTKKPCMRTTDNHFEEIGESDVTSYTVAYLHRTVAEFLASDEVWDEMCAATTGTEFDLAASLTSAFLSTLKKVHHLANRRRDQGLWTRPNLLSKFRPEYVEYFTMFCQMAKDWKPQLTHKYLLELDQTMRDLSKLDDGLHWSLCLYDCFNESDDGFNRSKSYGEYWWPDVEKHTGIYTFAANVGLLYQPDILPKNTDPQTLVAMFFYAMKGWEQKPEFIKTSADTMSRTLKFLFAEFLEVNLVAYDMTL
jgi:hypothetical protein